MRIGIIGAGQVGGTLGRGWAAKGHQVTYGVRDPKAANVGEVLKGTGHGAKAATVAEAASQAEVVVLTTPWDAVQEALRSAGTLSGKVLLDCTNLLKPDLSGLTVGHTKSAGEQVAEWAPGAMVVKIFNTTGFGNMADPKYPEGAPTMFYAGDDPAAKAVAAGLATDLGFDAVDAGPLANARLLEPFGMLWIYLAVLGGQGRDIAFRLMR